MGVRSLDELPKLPDMSGGEGMEELQRKIEQLQESSGVEQISLDEIKANEE